jgi:carboxymethylenebutenolidase
MAEPGRIGALSVGYPRMLPPTATVLHTDADGLEVGEVWIPVPDGELPAYRAAPSGSGLRPILLVVQEVFGVDEYLKDVCRRAAQEGFVAIAPELCARQGKPIECTSREELFAVVGAVPDSQVMDDLDACVRFAEASCRGDASRAGITGFCWGGRIAWLYAAHSPTLRAAVAWYGRLVSDTDPRHPKHPLDVAGALHAPVLGLYGSADPGIPLDTVERMKAALAAAKSPSEFVIYDGAPHAFHADYRASYQAEPARDGWKRMLDWLRANGAG